MASSSSRPTRPERELRCPACRRQLPTPPVPPPSSCRHGVCKACLEEERWAAKPTTCENSSVASPARADVLMCPLHGQKISLFCLDHQQMACVACLDHQQMACVACRGADQHKEHRFRAVEEVARRRREELRDSLEPLRRRAEVYHEARGDAQLLARRHAALREAEAGVRHRTDALLGFLRREERARVAALREEAATKSRDMKEKRAGLSSDMAALSDALRAVDEQLRDHDPASFLCKYKLPAGGALTLQDPQDTLAAPAAALLDVASHLGNLAFRAWLGLKGVVTYSPVVLDPNTAGPGILVSPDLTMIAKGYRSAPGDGPGRRQQDWPNVLGSLALSQGTPGGDVADTEEEGLSSGTLSWDVDAEEGLSSGTQSWDVDTGDCERWVLGVLAESYARTGDSEGGFWEIMRYGGKYMAHSSSQGSRYLAVTEVQRVRVHLDRAGGRLSFYDCDSNALLHAFTHIASTQRLYPLFYNDARRGHLRLLPGKVGVTLESHR